LFRHDYVYHVLVSPPLYYIIAILLSIIPGFAVLLRQPDVTNLPCSGVP